MSDQNRKQIQIPANISIRDFSQLIETSLILIIKN